MTQFFFLFFGGAGLGNRLETMGAACQTLCEVLDPKKPATGRNSF